MVVIEVRSKNAAEVTSVQDDDVVETLAPDSTDHPLDAWRLPRLIRAIRLVDRKQE
jgi:hypothetical protein